MSRVFVTGIGIISPLGDTLSLNHTALKNGICGINRLELIHSNFAGKLPVGEIKTETNTLKEKLKVKETGYTRNSLLAIHAFKDAINNKMLIQKTVVSNFFMIYAKVIKS